MSPLDSTSHAWPGTRRTDACPMNCDTCRRASLMYVGPVEKPPGRRLVSSRAAAHRVGRPFQADIAGWKARATRTGVWAGFFNSPTSTVSPADSRTCRAARRRLHVLLTSMASYTTCTQQRVSAARRAASHTFNTAIPSSAVWNWGASLSPPTPLLHVASPPGPIGLQPQSSSPWPSGPPGNDEDVWAGAQPVGALRRGCGEPQVLAYRKAHDQIFEAVRHGPVGHPETMKMSGLRFVGSVY